MSYNDKVNLDAMRPDGWSRTIHVSHVSYLRSPIIHAATVADAKDILVQAYGQYRCLWGRSVVKRYVQYD